MRLSSGLWKSLPREASRPNSSAVSAYFDVLRRRVAAGHDLDAAAAVGLELGEQRVLLGRRELVAGRMRDDGDAAGLADPAHRVAQLRPAVRHVAGLAFGEEAAEDLVRVGHTPLSTRKRAKCVRETRSGLPTYFSAPS